ncbi:MAG TPA: hypothetical protein VIO36_09505 [Anaerolineaceae bacterium]
MKRVFPWRLLLPCLPALALLPFLGRFPYAAYSAYSDLAISHYPNLLYLQHALREFGQVPLWSNTILSGYPFAANPLSGLWYPPGWLALLFPLPFGLNLVTALHAALGGVGMYCFLRGESLRAASAAFGGLAFAALPRLAAHFASGHWTLVMAACWTPWLLWSARKGSVLQAVFFGAILLADLRWAVYAGLLWSGYAAWHALRACQPGLKQIARVVLRIAIYAMVGLLMAAPLLLPLAEYSSLSTRAQMGAEGSLYLSLPLARLAGFLVPSLDGNTEWTVYPGAMLTLALIWYGLQPRRWRGKGFWLISVALAILLALGANIPGGALLARLPGFSMLRVPARSLLVAGFALAVLAAHLLDDLIGSDQLKQRSAYFSRLASAGAAGLTLLAASGVTLLSGEAPVNFWWGAAFLVAGVAVILLRDAGRIGPRTWTAAAFCLLALDLFGVSAQSMYFRSAPDVLAEGAQAAEWISQQPGEFRVYSPDYSLPQQTAAAYGLELVNGIDPLQLRQYAGELSQAAGISLDGYDVVLPPLAENGDAGQPDAALLGRYNVFYVASRAKLDVDGLVEVEKFDNVRVYRNVLVQPRAWVEGGAVKNRIIQPNRITLQASGPGRLVLAEIAYPGWQATVDGQRARMETAGLLRAVTLEAGDHTVEFLFRPWRVYAGLGLSLAGIVCVILLSCWRKVRR